MKVWRKQTVRWRLAGKSVPRATPKAKRDCVLSKRYYGTLNLSSGKRKQVPLTEDRDTSETLLRRLQTDEDTKRANGADRYYDERRKLLTDLLDEYEAFLRSKGNTNGHVSDTMSYCRKLVAATKAKVLDDLNATRITNTLAAWRKRKTASLSVSTTNHYLVALKGFSRWLWQERKSPDDPLANLKRMNTQTDRKRVRRALTADELTRLTQTTERSGQRCYGLSASDRAMLYRVAAYTGLRVSELASLTHRSFDLEAKTVTVEAAYSKRRRNDVLPLHCSLIGLLSVWLPTKGSGTLWHGAWKTTRKTKAARMLRHDLKAAAIPYVDGAGRVADFHALRHTFISSLARNGVHPAKAKELARHSTITLTMDVYSHVETEELRAALDTLPAVG